MHPNMPKDRCHSVALLYISVTFQQGGRHGENERGQSITNYDVHKPITPDQHLAWLRETYNSKLACCKS